MKKIIALAVAGAFVAPVYAADVSVGGSMEFAFKTVDGSQDSITDGGNELIIGASEEVNGLTVSTQMVLGLDGIAGETTTEDTDDANGNDVFASSMNITVAGAFGTVAVGDVSGGLDSYGDYTDVSPAGAGFDGDGADSAMSFSPNLGIDGLSVTVGWSPEGGANYTRDDEQDDDSGVAADHTSYGISYNIAGGQIYAGNEETGNASVSAMGIKYSTMGMTIAYEAATAEDGAGDEDDLRGISLTYKMDNLVLGMELQKEDDDDGTVEQDEQAVFAEYNLGSNVDIYVVKLDDDKAGTETNYVGIEYNF